MDTRRAMRFILSTLILSVALSHCGFEQKAATYYCKNTIESNQRNAFIEEFSIDSITTNDSNASFKINQVWIERPLYRESDVWGNENITLKENLNPVLVVNLDSTFRLNSRNCVAKWNLSENGHNASSFGGRVGVNVSTDVTPERIHLVLHETGGVSADIWLSKKK